MYEGENISFGNPPAWIYLRENIPRMVFCSYAAVWVMDSNFIRSRLTDRHFLPPFLRSSGIHMHRGKGIGSRDGDSTLFIVVSKEIISVKSIFESFPELPRVPTLSTRIRPDLISGWLKSAMSLLLMTTPSTLRWHGWISLLFSLYINEWKISHIDEILGKICEIPEYTKSSYLFPRWEKGQDKLRCWTTNWKISLVFPAAAEALYFNGFMPEGMVRT